MHCALQVLQVSQPRLKQVKFFAVDYSDPDQLFVTQAKVVWDAGHPGRKTKPFERRTDFPVVQIPRHLIGEVTHKDVLVALLIDTCLVEQNRPAIQPCDALGNEATPDVSQAT